MRVRDGANGIKRKNEIYKGKKENTKEMGNLKKRLNIEKELNVEKSIWTDGERRIYRWEEK